MVLAFGVDEHRVMTAGTEMGFFVGMETDHMMTGFRIAVKVGLAFLIVLEALEVEVRASVTMSSFGHGVHTREGKKRGEVDLYWLTLIGEHEIQGNYALSLKPHGHAFRDANRRLGIADGGGGVMEIESEPRNQKRDQDHKKKGAQVTRDLLHPRTIGRVPHRARFDLFRDHSTYGWTRWWTHSLTPHSSRSRLIHDLFFFLFLFYGWLLFRLFFHVKGLSCGRHPVPIRNFHQFILLLFLVHGFDTAIGIDVLIEGRGISQCHVTVTRGQFVFVGKRFAFGGHL